MCLHALVPIHGSPDRERAACSCLEQRREQVLAQLASAEQAQHTHQTLEGKMQEDLKRTLEEQRQAVAEATEKVTTQVHRGWR